MAAGDTLNVYPASVNLTVTNLAGIASSATWVVGWTSGTIDNSTTRYTDIIHTGKILVESSGLSAGLLQLWMYMMLDDSNWPDIFSSGTPGTEGAATLRDTEIRDGLLPLWGQATDTTASRTYPMRGISVRSRAGYVPDKYALFFAQSSGNTLETSGQQMTYKGLYENTVP